jgi:hypothetical protein
MKDAKKQKKQKFSKGSLTCTAVQVIPLLAAVSQGKNPNGGSKKTVRWPRIAGHLLLVPQVADRSPQVLESHGS